MLAALPLTGMGCGTSSGTVSEQLSSAFTAFCLKLAECYPSTGETVEECVQYYGSYYSDVADGCLEIALASYFQCLGGLTCDEYANDLEQCYQVAVDAVGPECDLTENSTPVDSASR